MVVVAVIGLSILLGMPEVVPVTIPGVVLAVIEAVLVTAGVAGAVGAIVGVAVSVAVAAIALRVVRHEDLHSHSAFRRGGLHHEAGGQGDAGCDRTSGHRTDPPGPGTRPRPSTPRSDCNPHASWHRALSAFSFVSCLDRAAPRTVLKV